MEIDLKRVGGPKKLKILCLHGFRTSGSILQFQSRELDLGDFEPQYLDAPISASGPPLALVKSFFPPPYYEWWALAGDKYNGLAETLSFIREYNRSNGPFDGVLGFSQGGCLAAILCAQRANNLPDCILPEIRFGVIFSGFAPIDPAFSNLFANNMRFPCFFSYGKTDFKKEDCIKLAAKFEGSVVVEHTADHQVPRKAMGSAMEELRSFLAVQATANIE